MNVNEWGVHLWFSVGFDLSGNTSLSLIFTKPDGTEQTVTSPDVMVGATDVNTTFGLFPAHKYFDYVFTATGPGVVVDQVGTWSVRGTYTDSTQHLISDVATFVVNP